MPSIEANEDAPALIGFANDSARLSIFFSESLTHRIISASSMTSVLSRFWIFMIPPGDVVLSSFKGERRIGGEDFFVRVRRRWELKWRSIVRSDVVKVREARRKRARERKDVESGAGERRSIAKEVKGRPEGDTS